jgi:inosine-uridine nucleoside N-ribohydrolase
MDDPFALALLVSELGPQLELVITTGTREAALLAAQLLVQGSADGGALLMPTVAQGLPPQQPSTLNPKLARSVARPPALTGYLNSSTLLPELDRMVRDDGLSAARDVVEAVASARGLVLWLCIGPPTNLAAFANRFPHLTRHVTVGLMGGSSRPGIKLPWANDCCTTPIVEWNIAQDAAASRAVLSRSWAAAPVFAPIDSTWDSELGGEGFQRLLAAAFPSQMCRNAYEMRMELAGTGEYRRRWGRHGYEIATVTDESAGKAVDCKRGAHRMAKALLQMYLGWLNEVLLAGPESVSFQEASYLQTHKVWRRSTPPLYDVFAAAQLLHADAFDVRRAPLLIADTGATIVPAEKGGVEVLWGWECIQPAALWRDLLHSFLDNDTARSRPMAASAVAAA